MNQFLEKYILEYDESTNVRYKISNPKLYHRLSKEKLGRVVYFSKKNDKEPTSFNDIVRKYLCENENEPCTKDIPVVRYSNVRDECLGVLKSFDCGYIVTNNPLFEATMSSILNPDHEERKLLEINLWVKSAEAIFSLDRIKHIDICCNHPLVLDLFKSNLFHKNHIFRNQIIDLFNKTNQDISQKKKYSFTYLATLHYDFLTSITQNPLENILKNYPDIQVNVYEYIGILEEALESYTYNDNTRNQIEIISPEELPWIKEKKNIWIGGLNSQFQIDKTFLRGSATNIVGLSEHIFSNGQFSYCDPGFSSSKIIDKTIERLSSVYTYVPACPSKELRKNTFAINHITKLLNNPYNFYVENILKLKSQNFHPNHILGIMVHAVFEELIKETNIFKDFEYTLAVLRSLLRKNHFSRSDYLLVSKKSEVMIKHLFDILKDASEVYAEHEGVQKIIHNGKEYFLHGRADLIYKKNEKYGVIDFKTGNPPSWFNIINGSAPQVPIAMLMLRFGGFLEKPHSELAESGFISPKGLLKIEHDAFILESAISGISNLITAFWEEEREYHHHTDPNAPYRIIARQVSF